MKEQNFKEEEEEEEKEEEDRLDSNNNNNNNKDDEDFSRASKVKDIDLVKGDKDTENHLKLIDSERRSIWKLDLSIIPIVSMFYFLSFLDRSNLANARVAGLQKSLGISDHQYSVALTVTYVPYIMAEIPANLLLKRVGPNIFLPTIVTLWGFITVMQGFVKGYVGLVLSRFFLGLVEGGMMPGIVLYLSFFYTRRELQLRIALFFSAASLSGAFSGLLAYGLIKLDGTGDLPGWAWIFIIEGLFTFFWGITSFFIFPSTLQSNRFLNENDKAILSERLLRDRSQTSLDDDNFSWTEVLASIRSPHVLITFAALFLSGTALYSLAYFQPSIINSMGYSQSRTQLLSVPPFAAAFVVMLFTAYVSDRYCARGLTICACALLGMIGFLLFYIADVDQRSLKYGSLFLSTSGIYSTIPPLSAWQANNSEGHFRRATSIAFGFVASNSGGILSTWLFPRSQSPQYRTGTIVNLVCSNGMIILAILNIFWLARCNRNKAKNRDKIISDFYEKHDLKKSEKNSKIIKEGQEQGAGEKEEEDLKTESIIWKKLGDRHPDFVYAY